MRLLTFRIKNFKSIIDTGECQIAENDNILVLAGQNEAGKSAIIEALNLFRNGVSPDFERLHKRQDLFPEITCKFKLIDEDIKKIAEQSNNDNLIKYLHKNLVIEFARGTSASTDNTCLERIRFSDSDIQRLTPYFTGVPEKQKEAAKPQNTEQDQGQNKTEPQLEKAAQAEVQPSFGLNDLENLLLADMRIFIFYDTFKDLLPGVVTVSEINKFPAVLDFQKVFKVNFADEVKKEERAITRTEQKLNKAASDDLNTYWKQKIEEGGKYNFDIKINTQPPPETASKIEFKIDRDDIDPLYMEQKSKGFCWFSAFNLRLKSLGIEESTINKLVILIDEPGQGLHEKAQEDVKTVLEELASKGAQLIYTTHYPNLIGTEGKEFARIRLVSHTKTAGTKIDTVSQFASKDHVGALDTLSPIITAMGMRSISPLIDNNRCNVVVEGISDFYYLEAFKKILGKSSRLCFIPSCGANNVPNVFSVLIGWGFDSKAVLDDDKQSGRKAYNLLKKEFYENSDELAHNHIYKITDCNGIEDVFSVEDFYKYVLNESLPKSKNRELNSRIANGRKELLSRLFLEKIGKEEVKLTQKTLRKIGDIFQWLYEKLNLSDEPAEKS